MSQKKKVIVNSFFYIFSSLLVKAVGFLLLPLYTLFLDPDEFGIINIVNGFVQVAVFIVAFSLYSAAIRFYSEYKDDRPELKKFYGTIVSFLLVSGIIFIFLGIVFKRELIEIVFNGITFYPYVLLSLIILYFVTLQTMYQNILQARQEGKKLTILNLITFGLTVLLKILFLVILKQGASGFLVSQLIVNILYSFYMIIDLKKNGLFEFRIHTSMLRKALKYSIPIIPHNLSTNIASLVSKILINKTGKLIMVGLYGIAVQFGMLIDVIQYSVNRAFQPWFFNMMSKKDSNSNSEILFLTKSLLSFYTIIYVGIGLFSQELVILMTPDQFTDSWLVIPILAVGFSVKSIYYFYVNIVMYHRSTAKKLFIATILGSVSDILLAYLLIPSYGMFGAACAFLIAKVIVVATTVFISKAYNDIGYRVVDMLKIIIPSFFFMGAGLYLSYTKYTKIISLENVLIKMIVFTLYVGYVYLQNRETIIKVIKSGDIKKMMKLNKKISNADDYDYETNKLK